MTNRHHSTSFVVKGLSEDREYIFRVKAINIHGESLPGRVSEPVSFGSNTTVTNVEPDKLQVAKERKLKDTVKCIFSTATPDYYRPFLTPNEWVQ